MIQFRKSILTFFILPLLFVACNPNSDERPRGVYDSGILIVNEGAFGANDGEVTHLDPSTGTLTSALFEKANGRPFAGLLEDLVLEEDRLYLVANTGKVEVVQPGDFKTAGAVNKDLDQPRSLATARGKLFISDYGPYDASYNTPSSYVAVVQGLDGGVVKKKIPVSSKPEDLFTFGSYVFVASSEGKKVEVLDANAVLLSKTLEMPGKPVQFFELNGDLWVFCYDAQKVYFVSISKSGLSQKEIRTFPIAQATGRMALGDKDAIYVLTSSGYPEYRDGISVVNILSGTLVSDWKKGTGFYGIGYDSDRQQVYLANAKGFQGNGEVLFYQKSGAEVGKLTVGRGPSGFLFR
ncbi:MAG: surface layer protein [Bacteroidetes bacterium]|nr:surface layer protein [Bacteroidota bacterium]MDA1267908.1 surface layer protein [Bacteroidota bacterium]